jgi:hypothetical protein
MLTLLEKKGGLNQPAGARAVVAQAAYQKVSTSRYERDVFTNERHCRSERIGAV